MPLLNSNSINLFITQVRVVQLDRVNIPSNKYISSWCNLCHFYVSVLFTTAFQMGILAPRITFQLQHIPRSVFHMLPFTFPKYGVSQATG